MATIKRRFLSMTMVLGIGFMLLVSLVLSSALGRGRQLLQRPAAGRRLALADRQLRDLVRRRHAAVRGDLQGLPDATIKWGDVWVGAAFTALLFTVGKLLIGPVPRPRQRRLDVRRGGLAAGVPGVGVLLGADPVLRGRVHPGVRADYGSHIEPSEDAIAMDEVVRADQGMPHASAVEKAAPKRHARQGERPGLGREDGKAEGPQAGGRAREGRRGGCAGSSDDRRGSNGKRPTGRQWHRTAMAQQRQFGAPPVRPHSKWNKKANQVGEDGTKQPNARSGWPGLQDSLKSLIRSG
jgi:membrane protein